MACAVCKRVLEGQSRDELESLGWTLAEDAALCPDCRGLGWQLPEDGGLPFRAMREVAYPPRPTDG